MMILAHACGMISSIENTLEGMAIARDQGAHGIEIDVQLSKDGQPVVFHDRNTERLTGKRLLVPETNFKELRELRVQGRYLIPHLHEALEFLNSWKPGLLYIDYHNCSLNLAESVARTIAEHSLEDRAFPLTFYRERRYLTHTRAVNPKIRLALMPEYPWVILKRSRELAAERVCIGWDRLWYNRYLFKALSAVVHLPTVIKEAQAEGFVVSAGVANTPEDIRWVERCGAQGIWTDDVPLCRKILEEG